MGYRPEDQSLENPANKIIEGIDEFIVNSTNREDSGEWKDEHIDEIIELSSELIKLRSKMRRITKDNW